MPSPQTPPSAPQEPLWRLLYRYIWPFQYFRDVTKGSRMERQQAYRFNREMRGCLPGFALKWAVLTGLWFAAGIFLDASLSLVIPAAGCFITGAWTLTTMLMMIISWAWLERFPELY